MKKYFYIIQRNGLIIEKEFDLVTYRRVIEEWQRGGLIFIKLQGQEVPTGINAADISNILTDETYRNYINTARPKQYILDGIWYDSKEHREIRLEAWKQQERLDSQQKALQAPEAKPITPAEKKKIEARKAKIRTFLTGLKEKARV